MGHAKLLFALLFVSAEVYNSFATSFVAPSLAVRPSTTPRPSLEANHELEKHLHLNLTKSDPLIKIMRPIGEFGPTKVKTNIYVRDIRMTNLNPEDKNRQLYDWTVDLTFRQRWNDPRLKYDREGMYPDFKFFPLNQPKSIWTPDLFFPESVKGDFHFITSPNMLLWVYPNGNVLYSLRITVQLRCKQSVNSAISVLDCPMRIASYGYTSDQIDLKWDEEPKVEIRSDLYIPGFELQNVTTKEGEVSTRSGEFSTITADFHFKKPEEIIH